MFAGELWTTWGKDELRVKEKGSEKNRVEEARGGTTQELWKTISKYIGGNLLNYSHSLCFLSISHFLLLSLFSFLILGWLFGYKCDVVLLSSIFFAYLDMAHSPFGIYFKLSWCTTGQNPWISIWKGIPLNASLTLFCSVLSTWYVVFLFSHFFTSSAPIHIPFYGSQFWVYSEWFGCVYSDLGSRRDGYVFRLATIDSWFPVDEMHMALRQINFPWQMRL